MPKLPATNQVRTNAQISLGRPDQTLSLVGSGHVVYKFHYTDSRTLRPDQTRPTDKVRTCMSRLSEQVYDQTKSADLSETQAVRGSGLVGSDPCSGI